MTLFWKIIIIFNLVMSCISLFVLYDRFTYNPYDYVGDEINKIQSDINQLNTDMEKMKQDLEGISSNVVRR